MMSRRKQEYAIRIHLDRLAKATEYFIDGGGKILAIRFDANPVYGFGNAKVRGAYVESSRNDTAQTERVFIER